MAKTQLDHLMSHLKSGRSITSLEALGLYGAFRLAARIKELRERGWDITTNMKQDINGKAYAEYVLNPPKTVLPERYRGSSYQAAA
jgi:hypothetical protein